MSYRKALNDLATKLIEEDYPGVVAEDVTVIVEINQVRADSYYRYEPTQIDLFINFKYVKRVNYSNGYISRCYDNQIEFLKELLG
jgi:hypothetical protein